jgi:hypothetical protein
MRKSLLSKSPENEIIACDGAWLGGKGEGRAEEDEGGVRVEATIPSR